MDKVNKKLSQKKAIENRRRMKTEAQRKRRERINKDPEAYEMQKEKERERYHKRKQDGKIKTIHELSKREKKFKRKSWKESSKKYRDSLKKQEQVKPFLNENSPPSCSSDQPNTSKKEHGRKKLRRDRAKAYRKIKKLENEVEKIKAKANKYKSRYFRLLRDKENVENPTPSSKVRQLVRGESISPAVRKKLLFHESLTTQMAINFSSLNKKEKQKKFIQAISGKVLKKYKCLRKLKFLSYKVLRSSDKGKYLVLNKTMVRMKKDVSDFLEKDECSRVCPGKKDTITRKGIKKQKRLLNNTMKNLHTEFQKMQLDYTISYSTFCKLRPFWILPPNVNKRDTCLCVICQNGELIVCKLKGLDIIRENSVEDVCKSLCCNDEIEEKCLERKCVQCNNKKINYKDYVSEEVTQYERWSAIVEVIQVSGREKKCKKNIKESVKCTKEELAKQLETIMPNLMQHIANRNHQYKEMNKLKRDLNHDEILVHADFSENYNCKYSEEIQLMHFGGSRQQITLHTVIVYYKTQGTTDVLHKSYCTISNSLRHDPVGIFAHLQPLLTNISAISPNLKRIHFLSDGPSTQYRNRKMFHLIAVHIPKCLPQSLQSITWNCSERGHGKGAPDGIGGCLKRVADSLVARGEDVESFQKLADMLKQNVLGIQVIPIPVDDVEKFADIFPEMIKPFKGTLRTHQVLWSESNPHLLTFRRLSCYQCLPSEICDHYAIGSISIESSCGPKYKYTTSVTSVTTENSTLGKRARLHYDDVYSTDSESEEKPKSLQHKQVCVNDYVVVQFSSEKSVKYYIGVVLSIDDDNYTVKFLRLKKEGCFVFPDRDDVTLVDRNDIIEILKDQPEIDRRGQYFFTHDFSNLKGLC